jgi:electron transport complex protein RnfG
MKVKDVAKQNVDGVTGATITSDAMKKNVQLGVEYYLKHK